MAVCWTNAFSFGGMMHVRRACQNMRAKRQPPPQSEHEHISWRTQHMVINNVVFIIFIWSFVHSFIPSHVCDCKNHVLLLYCCECLVLFCDLFSELFLKNEINSKVVLREFNSVSDTFAPKPNNNRQQQKCTKNFICLFPNG